MARKRGDQFGGGGSMASSGRKPRRPQGIMSMVTSASGTPGPAGVLTTGHYSSGGQRRYGAYSSQSGRHPSAQLKYRQGKPKLPETR